MLETSHMRCCIYICIYVSIFLIIHGLAVLPLYNAFSAHEGASLSWTEKRVECIYIVKNF